MKQKTKKRLRRLLTPFACVWVCIAITVAVIGVMLTSLGFYMVNDSESAKEAFKQIF